MSTARSKDAVNQHKRNSIRKINRLLEGYIFSDRSDLVKKADLISYWLETFSDYIAFEEKFDSTRLIRYSRGDVIRVNFGFNIGKEFGGLHYAVVIDNHNNRNADVVTVIPLSSSDGKQIHHRNVDLGTELFEKVDAVQKNLLLSAKSELKNLEKMFKMLDNSLKLSKQYVLTEENLSVDMEKQLNETFEYKNKLAEKISDLENSISIIQRNKNEISRLKKGSMAIVNQVTTISKQRIYTPKRSEDFLYGISLSAYAMNKINDRLKELYIFE